MNGSRGILQLLSFRALNGNGVVPDANMYTSSPIYPFTNASVGAWIILYPPGSTQPTHAANPVPGSGLVVITLVCYHVTQVRVPLVLLCFLDLPALVTLIKYNRARTSDAETLPVNLTVATDVATEFYLVVTTNVPDSVMKVNVVNAIRLLVNPRVTAVTQLVRFAVQMIRFHQTDGVAVPHVTRCMIVEFIRAFANATKGLADRVSMILAHEEIYVSV